MRGMIDYAIYYQQKGFSVIPISKDGKKPLVAFADKPAFTEHELRLLWKDNPDANIALRTDSFFVIDIDVHNGVDGLKNLREWEHARLIPKTLQATTPSGGRHIHLKKPQGVSMAQNIGFVDGVDLKAHVNNYVLVPPSNNAKGMYVWDKVHSPTSGEMTEAPLELITVLQELKPAYEYDASSFTSGDYQGSNKTAKLFETIVLGFGDTGGRNNSLAEFVGGLLLRNVDVEIAYTLAKMANHKTVDPLNDKEFDRTFKSMCDKELRRRSGL